MTAPVRSIAAALIALALGGCGGDPAATAGEDSASAAAAPAVPKLATRAAIEQAYRCHGLTQAALAAKTIIGDDFPGELTALDRSILGHWQKQVGNIQAGVFPAAEETDLMVKSSRVFATRAALDREVAAIRACIDAAR